MSKEYPITIYKEPNLRRSSLVLGWSEDMSNLGRKATGYLNRKLKGQEFAEIGPEDFFSLGGVAIEGNLAQFPESKFYTCREHELVVFQSGSPGAEWYKFLNAVLDVADHHCQVKRYWHPQTHPGNIPLFSYPQQKSIQSRPFTWWCLIIQIPGQFILAQVLFYFC